MDEQKKRQYRETFQGWARDLYGTIAHGDCWTATMVREQCEEIYLMVSQDMIVGKVFGNFTDVEYWMGYRDRYDCIALLVETFDSEQEAIIRETRATAYEVAGFSGMIERMEHALEQSLDIN